MSTRYTPRVTASAGPGTETPPTQTSLFRSPDFVRVWVGEALSLYGTQVTLLALPLTAITTFGASPAEVGLLRFLQLVPYLLLALVFGAWADRRRKRPVLIVANLARLLLILAIPVMHWLHLLSIGSLLAVAAGIGCFSVLFDVAWMSFIPTVVADPERYLEANQKLGVTASSAEVAGPGLAGLLVAALGAPVALVADSASYLVSLVSLATVRTAEPEPPPAAGRHLGREIRAGLSFVFRHPTLRPLALLGAVCNFSMISIWTVFLLYAARTEHLSSALIGIVFSASSVGGLIGGLLSRRVLTRFRAGRVYATAMTMIFTAPLLLLVVAGSKPVLVATFVASFFVAYLGLGIANVLLITLRQTSTPPPLMARMNAAFRMLLFGGGSLGALLGGLIAQSAGIETGLRALAIGSAAIVVLVFLSPVSRLRTL